MAPTATDNALAKYRATQRNQANMTAVSRLLVQEGSTALAAGEGLGQQEMGGFLRLVVPGLVDKYGKINATAAVQYYDEQRAAWLLRNGTGGIGPANRVARNNRRNMAARYAAARTRSQVYLATMPKFDAMAKSEPVIGYAMSRYMGDGFEALHDAALNAMSRAVGSYNRDTILYNAGLDSAVVRVQRVAEPNACAFCSMVALSSPGWTVSEVRTADYAIDFHDHCHCSIETLYEGDSPIRPDYYDKIESEYAKYYDGTVKGTLSEWRAGTGRS